MFHPAEPWVDRMFEAAMTLYGAMENAQFTAAPELQRQVVRRQWRLCEICRDVARFHLAGQPVPETLLRDPVLQGVMGGENANG